MFIRKTKEFERISQIDWENWADFPIKKITHALHKDFRKSDSQMSLRPIQAAALYSFYTNSGAFLPVGVGQGKTLISLLTVSIPDYNRPLLLLPASLRDKCLDLDLPRLSQHWKLNKNFRLLSYSELSLEKNKDVLDELEPDLIVIDEAHHAKNPLAACTRRIGRYIGENPNVEVMAMSGTFTQRSIKDYAHIVDWCLRSGSPLPRERRELDVWASAIDENVQSWKRAQPGVLLKFCRESDEKTARTAYFRRLTNTPGVVLSGAEDGVDASIRLTLLENKISPKLKELVDDYKETWTLPNGDCAMEVVAFNRHLKELLLGFYYEWDPPPPEHWMTARKTWAALVRRRIALGHGDTERQIKRLYENGQKGAGRKIYSAWEACKDDYKISTKPVWVDPTSTIEAVKRWQKAHRHDQKIIWVSQQSFAIRLASAIDVPYFGSGVTAELIESCPDDTIVLSDRAHKTGKDIQSRSRNLILTPSSNSVAWEQLTGRTHRVGQKADTVYFDVLVRDQISVDSISRAMSSAEYTKETTGMSQKLLLADISREVI